MAVVQTAPVDQLAGVEDEIQVSRVAPVTLTWKAPILVVGQKADTMMPYLSVPRLLMRLPRLWGKRGHLVAASLAMRPAHDQGAVTADGCCWW